MSAALVAVGGLFDLAGALAPRWIAVLNGRELLPPSLQTSARPLLLIMGLADAPPGTMELLISESMTDFADRGRETASLSAVPILQPEQRTDGVERLLGWLYDHASAVSVVVYFLFRRIGPRFLEPRTH